MLRKIGLSSLFALERASFPHGYHSTGLYACCNRYGLLSVINLLALILLSLCLLSLCICHHLLAAMIFNTLYNSHQLWNPDPLFKYSNCQVKPPKVSVYVLFKKDRIMQILWCKGSFVCDLENEPHRNHCCNHSNASQTVYSIPYICLLVCCSQNSF